MIIKKFSSFNENLIDRDLVDETSKRLLDFLSKNKIDTWEEFYTSEFARNTINKIIDTSVKTMEEFREVKFLMKLELCDVDQLEKLLKNYLKSEEFEKCQMIKDKIDKKNDKKFRLTNENTSYSDPWTSDMIEVLKDCLTPISDDYEFVINRAEDMEDDHLYSDSDIIIEINIERFINKSFSNQSGLRSHQNYLLKKADLFDRCSAFMTRIDHEIGESSMEIFDKGKKISIEITLLPSIIIENSSEINIYIYKDRLSKEISEKYGNRITNISEPHSELDNESDIYLIFTKEVNRDIIDYFKDRFADLDRFKKLNVSVSYGTNLNEIKIDLYSDKKILKINLQ